MLLTPHSHFSLPCSVQPHMGPLQQWVTVGWGLWSPLMGGLLVEKQYLQSILEKQQFFPQGLAGGEVHLCAVAICLLSSWGISGGAAGPPRAMQT